MSSHCARLHFWFWKTWQAIYMLYRSCDINQTFDWTCGFEGNKKENQLNFFCHFFDMIGIYWSLKLIDSLVIKTKITILCCKLVITEWKIWTLAVKGIHDIFIAEFTKFTQDKLKYWTLISWLSLGEQLFQSVDLWYCSWYSYIIIRLTLDA